MLAFPAVCGLFNSDFTELHFHCWLYSACTELTSATWEAAGFGVCFLSCAVLLCFSCEAYLLVFAEGLGQK